MRILESYHPLALFCYFAAVVLTGMFVWHPLILLEALLGGLLLLLILERAGAFFSDLGFYAALFLLVAATNPLFSHNGVTPLFFLNGNPVTKEALFYGAAIGCMAVGVLLWCRCGGLVFTSDKLMYLFGRVLPRLSLVFATVLRFVPLLRQKRRQVMQAQKAMGLYSAESRADRLRSVFRVYSALIGWALEHAMETAGSMKARGYGLPRRTNFHLYSWTRRDVTLLAMTGVLLLPTLFGAASGALWYDFYPAMDPVWERSLFGYEAAFLVLALLPFFLEGKENLKWKYYESKI